MNNAVTLLPYHLTRERRDECSCRVGNGLKPVKGHAFRLLNYRELNVRHSSSSFDIKIMEIG